MAASTLPTLVITHGAWHSPEYFHKIIPKLESAGYRCITPSLPAVGSDPPTTSLQPDIDVVHNTVQAACDSGEDVVVVAHSWSGIPVGCALEGLSKAERTQQGQPGGVVKIVFMAAFMLPVGMSLWDAVGGVAPGWWRFHGPNGETITPDDPKLHFYTDMSDEDAEVYAGMLRPHSMASVYHKATAAAFMTIPSVYIVCLKDEALDRQKAIVEMAVAAGADLQTVHVDAAHSPFLSAPDETVAIIRRAAGEEHVT